MSDVELGQLISTSLLGHGFVDISRNLPIQNDLISLLRHPIDPQWRHTFDEGFGVTKIQVDQTGWIAVSFLKRYQDEFNRPFIHNHTIFIPVDEYQSFGAHPDIVAKGFIQSPDLVALGESLEPLFLTSDINTAQDIQANDLVVVTKYAPTLSDLERLSACISTGQRCVVRVPASGGEATEFALSLLRIVPGIMTTVATFEPRRELVSQYRLRVLSDSSMQQSTCHLEESGPTAVTPEDRLLAQHVLSQNLNEVRATRNRVRHYVELNGLAASCEEARKRRDFREAVAWLEKFKRYLNSAKTLLEQSGEKAKYDQAHRRLEVELTLDMSLQRSESRHFCDALVEAAKSPEAVGKQELITRIGEVLSDGNISRQFKMEVVLFLLQRQEEMSWILEDNVVDFIRNGSPKELILENKADVAKIVHVLHGVGQSRDIGHDAIVAWLLGFDFQEELHKFVAHPDSESILLHLIDKVPDISSACPKCSELLLDRYGWAFNDFVPWPLYKLNPYLKSNTFKSVDELNKALDESKLFDKLKSQRERIGLSVRPVRRLRKRIGYLSAASASSDDKS